MKKKLSQKPYHENILSEALLCNSEQISIQLYIIKMQRIFDHSNMRIWNVHHMQLKTKKKMLASTTKKVK
jgi:hypothetical protein